MAYVRLNAAGEWDRGDLEPLDLTTSEDRRFFRGLREGVLRSSWLIPVLRGELAAIEASGQHIRAMAAVSPGEWASRKPRHSTNGAR